MPTKTLSDQAPARRDPRQARAREKIGLMFEATLRILEDEGLDALTTNRIAAVAGVSIGTLYQYFADKQALLAALAQRELTHTFAQLAQTLSDGPADGKARQAVRAMLGAFGGRVGARRQLMTALARAGQVAVFDAQMHELARALLLGQTAQQRRRVLLDEIQVQVLARAVSGVLRTTLLADPAMLRRPEFEDALVRLVVGFIGKQPSDAR